MVAQYAEVTDIFKALADPTRRGILSTLRHGGRSVGDIAKRFPVSRPAVSQHLRLLRQANLVVEITQGRNRIYQLNPEPLIEIDEWLSDYRQMWKTKLRNLKRYIERKGEN
jgi:DNA-binding transcriptional ArsR family regulator